MNDGNNTTESILQDFNILLETDLERTIVSSEDFLEGMFYGEERSGHPEGEIGWHVRDVLNNIDEYFKDDPDRERLRIAALVHDAMKFKARDAGMNHAEAAYEYLSQYTEDTTILNLVRYHDRPYKAFKARSGPNIAFRLSELKHVFGKDIGLLIKFYRCDNAVQGKRNDAYEWFEEQMGLVM
jgi:hypothetical protein